MNEAKEVGSWQTHRTIPPQWYGDDRSEKVQSKCYKLVYLSTFLLDAISENLRFSESGITYLLQTTYLPTVVCKYPACNLSYYALLQNLSMCPWQVLTCLWLSPYSFSRIRGDFYQAWRLPQINHQKKRNR